MSEHVRSECLLHLHITPQHIIDKPSNAPLTKMEEEKIGSSIVKHWIQSTNSSQPIKVPTGGQVNAYYHKSGNYYMFK